MHKYAVFILTHWRADNVITYSTLRRQGYTGKIYLIVDDEDQSLARYKENFGEEVIVFAKKDYDRTFDMMDNFNSRKVVVYARNACYDIARSMGLEYFFEYEDDYTQFQYKYVTDGSLKGLHTKKLDEIFEKFIDCLEKTKLDSIAFAQGGDFMGWNFKGNTYKRKVMNTFLFRVNQNPSDDLKFIGRMNDDVNLYISLGSVGKMFFQVSNMCLVQLETQSNQGGNTEVYKKFGTYVKSFYSVMVCPSACKISVLGRTDMRIHHRISWRNCVPKLIRESVKITTELQRKW